MDDVLPPLGVRRLAHRLLDQARDNDLEVGCPKGAIQEEARPRNGIARRTRNWEGVAVDPDGDGALPNVILRVDVGVVAVRADYVDFPRVGIWNRSPERLQGHARLRNRCAPEEVLREDNRPRMIQVGEPLAGVKERRRPLGFDALPKPVAIHALHRNLERAGLRGCIELAL